ncbi:MAG TPA: hypothetical protein VE093_15505 [Polyangiaceae bacterium]|jgi:hypothetical protein|nr:hypothetical protein [Polyangiaceae bacterium]
MSKGIFFGVSGIRYAAIVVCALSVSLGGCIAEMDPDAADSESEEAVDTAVEALTTTTCNVSTENRGCDAFITSCREGNGGLTSSNPDPTTNIPQTYTCTYP